jgi:hypothetical protein
MHNVHKQSAALWVILLMLLCVVASAAEPATAPASEPTTAPATTQASAITGPFRWVTTGPLIKPKRDPDHPINAIKDPTIVRYNGLWHVYATTVTDDGSYGMCYLNFADWKDAPAAPLYYMDANPRMFGYHCAPQVFYFAPQKLWYLIYQSQEPTYSVSRDISKPQTWSSPRRFFAQDPQSVVEGWLDYWIICDDTHAYLFFSDDHGRFYRSRTTLARFPRGFDEPVVAMQDPVPGELYEASNVYRLKGTNQYLAIIECIGKQDRRYFKAFTADRLDGPWQPLATTWPNSFACVDRVRSEDGSQPWSNDISHGELLRDGYDQTMTIDPSNLVLLYQGIQVGADNGKTYNEIPWQPGLLRRDK